MAMVGKRSAWGLAAILATGVSAPVMLAQGTSPTVKDDLFTGTEKFAKGASDVTEVTMDPQTLGLVNGKDSPRAHNMILNVVRTYEYDKPGMYRIEDVEEFRKKLDTGEWHCSIHTRDLKHGESTDICNRQRADGLVEQAIITVEPKELTFIHTIRRHGGDGSSVNLPDLGGIMSDLGPELASLGPAMATLGPAMAALRPQVQAEMQAAMAEMRAGQAGLGDGVHLQSPEAEKQLRALERTQRSAARDAERQARESLRDLERQRIPPTPPVPAEPKP